MLLSRATTVVVAAALLLVAAPGRAQGPAAPPSVPPGYAPKPNPAYEEQLRAQTEARLRAETQANVYRAALAEEESARRGAFIARAERARPPDIEVRAPLFETSLGMRAGGLSDLRRYSHLGPELTLGYRIDDYFVIELPASLLRSITPRDNGAALGGRPSFVASISRGLVTLRARAGLDALFFAGQEDAPRALVGAHLGVGFSFLATRVRGGGYGAFFVEWDGSLVGGVGGPSSPLDTVRGGVDGAVGVRFGF